MNAKELEIIKKLFKIATNQQKLIVKLAQARGINPIDPNAPVGSAGGDPLDGDLADPRTKEQVTQDVYKNFPWLHPTAPKGNTPAAVPTAPTPPVSTLDPTYKQMIDRVAPGLAGHLLVDVQGRNVQVQFDATHAYTTNQVQALMTKAFPGFYVKVTGHEHKNWTPNY